MRPACTPINLRPITAAPVKKFCEGETLKGQTFDGGLLSWLILELFCCHLLGPFQQVIIARIESLELTGMNQKGVAE